MCNSPPNIAMLRRFSSRASQGIAALFSIDKENKELARTSTGNNQKQKQKTSNNNQDSKQHTLHINPIVLVGCFLCFVINICIAYYAGTIFRIVMQHNVQVQSTHQAELNGPSSPPPAANLSFAELKDECNKQLPSPTVIPGKEVPPTTYTFQHFPTGGSRSNYDLYLDRSDEEHEHDNTVSKSAEDSSDDSSDDEDDNDDPLEGLHLPAGQHLLIDIKNVDPIFLNSEERLAEAMIQLVDESKLTRQVTIGEI